MDKGRRWAHSSAGRGVSRRVPQGSDDCSQSGERPSHPTQSCGIRRPLLVLESTNVRQLGFYGTRDGGFRLLGGISRPCFYSGLTRSEPGATLRDRFSIASKWPPSQYPTVFTERAKVLRLTAMRAPRLLRMKLQ